MPGNTLSITLPVVGSTVGPTYASDINNAIQALIDDVEAKIVPNEIDINEDLSFTSGGTAYSATGLDTARFTSRAALTTGSNAIHAVSGELYWRDGNGTNVQITQSGNVAGGSGDVSTTGSPAYGAPYEILWSGGDLEYRFKAGSGNTFADLVFADLEFRNGANTMTMTCPVSSDYTITWPATVGAANSLCAINGSGTITFTNDPTLVGLNLTTGDLDLTSGDVNLVAGDINFSGGKKIFSSGNATLGTIGCSTITGTSTITASGNITTSGSAHIYPAGTGRVVKGGPFYHQLNPWTATGSLGSTVTHHSDGAYVDRAYALRIPVPSPTAYWTDWSDINVYVQNTAVTANITATLYKVQNSTGTRAIVNSGGNVTDTQSCTSGVVTRLDLTFGAVYQTELGYTYYIEISTAAGSGNLYFHGGDLEYTEDDQGAL